MNSLTLPTFLRAIILVFKLILLFTVFLTTSSLAQPPSEDNDEIKKLKERIAVLEQQIKVAQNENELIKLQAENQKSQQELERQKKLQQETERQRSLEPSRNTLKPLIVKAEQPNVWTLEQAHYLLAQMHRRNLDLKTAALDNLDPNALNGVNIDILKTLLSVSAEFDQSIGANNNITGLNNSQIRDEKQFIAAQRRSLFIKRAELQNTSVNLTRQIGELKIRLLRANPQGEKEKLQEQIDELTVVQEVVKEQILQITQQLDSLSANDKDFQTFSAPKFTPEGSTTLTSSLATIAKNIGDQIINQPQLNASVRLDNYIQMQYEVLSKQLTLLRDEVGPGERLIFMELPQSVNVSRGNSKNKLAQSWWRIQGYSQCMIIDENIEVPCSKASNLDQIQQRIRLTTKDLVKQLLESTYSSTPTYNTDYIYVQRNEIRELNGLKRIIDVLEDEQSTFLTNLKNKVSELHSKSQQATKFHEYVIAYKTAKENSKPCRLDDVKPADIPDSETCSELIDEYTTSKQIVENFLLTLFKDFIDQKILEDYKDDDWSVISKRVEQFVKKYPKAKRNENDERYFRRIVLEEVFIGGIDNWRDVWQKLINLDGIKEEISLSKNENRKKLWNNYENRTVRVIDLFPKQSSLNVNDIKLRTNQFSGRFIFGLLSGFGAKTNYERMRERYSQFVQQELYSSAFGKGGRDFGWTFYPMPGTERLTSGVRTTYAVIIVPEETTALIFETKGCFFSRSAMQPETFDNENWENKGLSQGCSESKKLLVPLPNGVIPYSDSFKVNNISYKSVAKGEKAVIAIDGENFSSQIGIVIDGVPLSPSIGLGQPFIRDDSKVGEKVSTDFANSKIKGTFERVSSRQILATFEMGNDYQGTPVITLISPGTSFILNNRRYITVNDKSYARGLDAADYIFGKKVGTGDKGTKIESVDIFQENQEQLRILVKGERLEAATKIYVNGMVFGGCSANESGNKSGNESGNNSDNKPGDNNTKCFTRDTNGHLISIPFKTSPQIKTIKLTLLTEKGTLDSSSITNPAFDESKKGEPILAKYEVKNTFAFMNSIQLSCLKKDNKTIAIFELTGKGFTKNTKAYIKNKAQTISFEDKNGVQKIFLTIEAPELTQTVLLQDSGLEAQDEKLVLFAPNKDTCPN